MTDVDLEVVRDDVFQSVEELCQVGVHELHQQHWETSLRVLVHSKVLDNIGMFDGAKKLALLLKPMNG